MLSLQRDVEDLLEDFSVPRSMFREVERLFEGADSPSSIFRQMDRLLEDFGTPQSLNSRLTRLFEGFPVGQRMGSGMTSQSERFAPMIDVAERENEYVVKADLPGIKEKDIELKLEGENMLVLTGERREEETKNVRGYEYRERSYGRFTRSIQLPYGVDKSKIAADFRNGVLEIHLPKGEAAKAQRIPVSTASREMREGRDEQRTLQQQQQQGGGNGQNSVSGRAS